MDTIYLLGIYFLAGAVQNFLFILGIRFVAKDKAFLASVFSFLVTIVSLFALYSILSRLDAQRSIVAIIIYGFGFAVGTYLATKFKLEENVI